MKTKDFEKAVAALQADIFLDEVVLRRGNNVSAAYGHTTSLFVKWDEFGRGFTCLSPEDLTSRPCDPRMEAENWERSGVYDLQFD